MKKVIQILLVFILLLVVPSQLAGAKVIWDGAEIVKGQVGKMTFSKDVKVYKKNADGNFTSLVVKRGEFYRVYSVENSSVGKVYNMSSGYRVQATNLVIYKEVPKEIQVSVNGDTVSNNDTSLTATKRMVHSKSGASIYVSPSKSDGSYDTIPYGSVVDYLGSEKNNFLYINYKGTKGYILSSFLTNLPEKSTYYAAYGTSIYSNTDFSRNVIIRDLKRGQQVYVYVKSQDDYYVSVGDTFGYIPIDALSKTKPASAPVITGGLTPSTDIKRINLTNWLYHNGYVEWNGKQSWVGVQVFSDEGIDFPVELRITYTEDANQFIFSKDDWSLTIPLPVTEGDYVTIENLTSGEQTTETIKAIRPSYKGFSNVIETTNGIFIAPGAGVIGDGYNKYTFEY